MSTRGSHIRTKYLESNCEERYEDTSKKIHLAQRRHLSLKQPGDLQLGPYLTVSSQKNFVTTSGAPENSATNSSVCTIL